MEPGDFVEPEIGVAVAVTAAIASPTVRRTFRKGAAYGIAGLLLAGDAAGRFVRSVSQGARQVAQRNGVPASEASDAMEQTKAAASDAAEVGAA